MMFTQILDPLGRPLAHVSPCTRACRPADCADRRVAASRMARDADRRDRHVRARRLAWRMPVGDGLRAFLYGAATGVWAVDWITFWGVILFNTLTVTGLFAAADAQFGGRRGRQAGGAADRERRRRDEPLRAERRRGDPAQHGLDLRAARLSDFGRAPVLLLPAREDDGRVAPRIHSTRPKEEEQHALD